MIYETETGFYILKDSQGRLGLKANVRIGQHEVPEWVDKSKSFDLDSADELKNYEIDPYYLNL